MHSFDIELDSFLEGPSFDLEGNLYVVDIPFGRVFRISPDGNWTLVVEYDGEPNGLKFDREGRMFIADHKHGIMEIDPITGAIKVALDRPSWLRFNALLGGPRGTARVFAEAARRYGLTLRGPDAPIRHASARSREQRPPKRQDRQPESKT